MLKHKVNVAQQQEFFHQHLKIDQRKLTSVSKMTRLALFEELGATKYHRAAYNGYVDLLTNASKRDANKATQQQALTPTLIAAQNGHLEALRALVGRGGDPEKCDTSGATCLHLAAAQNHLNCVSFLVNFGVNMWSLDNDWHTAKDVAAICQRKEVLDYLDRIMARQSAINTKQVQKFKEKANKDAEKRLKELRKSQFKLMKQTEREKKQLLKITNSRPMLKGALSISDIRLVGKPVVTYASGYGLGFCPESMALAKSQMMTKSTSNLSNNPSTPIKSTNIIKQNFKSKSTNVVDNNQQQNVCEDNHSKSNISHHWIEGNLEVKEAPTRHRNHQHHRQSTTVDANNNSNYKQQPYEYDSGVSGGSSSATSLLSSNPSAAMLLTGGCSPKTAKTNYANSTNYRPRYSDLVAITPDLEYSRSAASSDASRPSSLIERAKKSRALASANKLNIRRLLNKVPQQKDSQQDAKATLSSSSSSSTGPSTRLDADHCSDAKHGSISDVMSQQQAKSVKVKQKSSHKSSKNRTEQRKQDNNKSYLAASMIELRSSPSDNMQTNQGAMSSTQAQNNINCHRQQGARTSRVIDSVGDTHDNTDSTHHLAKAYSQPDFNMITMLANDSGNCNVGILDEARFSRARGDKFAIIEDREPEDDDLNEMHHSPKSNNTNEFLTTQELSTITNEYQSDNNSCNKPMETYTIDDSKASTKVQHHMMLNECLSQLKLHRKNQQQQHLQHLQPPSPKHNLNNCTNNNRVTNGISAKAPPGDWMVGCASSTELLQHQRQAGELPLKPSLIKQHQMAVSKLSHHQSMLSQNHMFLQRAAANNKPNQNRARLVKVADSIGSASSLMQRTTESSSIASSSSSDTSSSSSCWSSSKSPSQVQRSNATTRADECMSNDLLVQNDDQRPVKQQPLELISNVNISKHVARAGEPTIEVFLDQNGLNELGEIFAREKIDFEALLLLNETDLKSINILLGPRRKLVKAIDDYKHHKLVADANNNISQQCSNMYSLPGSCNEIRPSDPPIPPPLPPNPPPPLSPWNKSMVDTKL